MQGNWRSKAVLQAMKGVKRSELFKNLRAVNDTNTITKKLHALNSQPNTMVKNNQPKDLVGSIS